MATMWASLGTAGSDKAITYKFSTGATSGRSKLDVSCRTVAAFMAAIIPHFGARVGIGDGGWRALTRPSLSDGD
jgi:hypothetical protein